MVEVSGVSDDGGTVVVVSSSGEAVMVVTPASPVVRRRSSTKTGLGQRLRDSVLSPGVKRRESLAILKQPMVSLLVAGRKITRSRSVSKMITALGCFRVILVSHYWILLSVSEFLCKKRFVRYQDSCYSSVLMVYV
ncbi:uncharacterized protein [Macrobrachium rosenbergii]|uniref:uncharacterized protein n=1 Tax=Macrobrachium rosenbergii TaxID=79674 RepID=UPI0034D48B89